MSGRFLLLGLNWFDDFLNFGAVTAKSLNLSLNTPLAVNVFSRKMRNFSLRRSLENHEKKLVDMELFHLQLEVGNEL